METMRLSIGNPLMLMTPSPYYISKQIWLLIEKSLDFRFEIMGVDKPQALDNMNVS